jgi:hypothetical protein
MIIDLNKKNISEEKTEIQNSKFKIRHSLLIKVSNIQHRIKNDELEGNDLSGVGLL